MKSEIKRKRENNFILINSSLADSAVTVLIHFACFMMTDFGDMLFSAARNSEHSKGQNRIQYENFHSSLNYAI